MAARIQLQLVLPLAAWAAVAVTAARAPPAQFADEDAACVTLLQTSTQFAAHLDKVEAGADVGAAWVFWIVICLLCMVLSLPCWMNFSGSSSERRIIEDLKRNPDIRQAVMAHVDGTESFAWDSDELKAAKFRTTLMDTYLIASGLICTVTATTFFIDNRSASAFIYRGSEVSLRFALRSVDQLVTALGTTVGLYSFVSFMLVSSYSRAAICRSYGSTWLYTHVLEITKVPRMLAFFGMYVAAVMTALELLIHAVSSSVMTSMPHIPSRYLDTVSLGIAALIAVILLMLIGQSVTVMRSVAIIFMPDSEIKRIFNTIRADLLGEAKPGNSAKN